MEAKIGKRKQVRPLSAIQKPKRWSKPTKHDKKKKRTKNESPTASEKSFLACKKE